MINFEQIPQINTSIVLIGSTNLGKKVWKWSISR